MATNEQTNPLESCELPEGFRREEVRGLGVCLQCEATKAWVNWTRNYERLGGTGPFHVRGAYPSKFDGWAKSLDDAAAIARKH